MATQAREETESVIFGFVDCLNRGDLQGAADLHADDLVFHMPGMPALDKQGWMQFNQGWYAAFPDLQINVDRSTTTVEGERAAGCYVLEGTHRGALMGIPATGRRIAVSGINLFRVRDGKIIEEWVSNDSLGLMQQLGVIPAPGGAN